MKPEEAIERLEYLESALDGYPPETGINDVFAAIDTAIEALKEVQQYREIGSVGECREAVERQKPKGCNIVKDYFRTYYNCPKCNHNLRVEYNRGSWMGKKSKNCDKCGQAIRWDENLEGMEDE